MQREIKFMAWCEIQCHTLVTVEGVGSHWKSEYEMCEVLQLNLSKGTMRVRWDIGRTADVEMKNLRQYTGLKDKNGKDIYEGDIVKTRYVEPDEDFLEVLSKPETGAVHWDEDFGGWSTGNCACIYTAKEIEVIGNIYENKELLHELPA